MISRRTCTLPAGVKRVISPMHPANGPDRSAPIRRAKLALERDRPIRAAKGLKSFDHARGTGLGNSPAMISLDTPNVPLTLRQRSRPSANSTNR